MASSNAAVKSARRSPNSRVRAEKAQLRPGHPAVLLSIAVGALLLLGLIMILSASSVASFATYGSSFLFFQRQLMWALIGLLCFVFFARLDYHRLSGFGYVLFPLVVGLLFAVLIPGVGVVSGGSARWISLGLFSFQPSELAKLALVLFAADVFSRKDESTFDTFSHTALPLIPALGILAVLVLLQPDLGTTLVLGSIGIGVLFVAGAPISFISPIVMAGALVTTVAALAEPYRRARIFAFLNPWADPFNTGYQTIQSLIAVGSGGWLGVGLGASRQKWLYVPNAHTDFIYAILAEETGLLGTFVVLGLFAFVTYMGIRTARRAPDRFGTLLAAGITIWIALQALVNIGAVIAALPITGVPLPLVSFGGTSLVVVLLAAGVLVNIAYQAESGPPQRPRNRPRRRPARSGRAPAARPRAQARTRPAPRRRAGSMRAARARGRGG
jgi:cell division protein FtsW